MVGGMGEYWIGQRPGAGIRLKEVLAIERGKGFFGGHLGPGLCIRF